MITPINQARRADNGSILAMQLERDAARFDLRKWRCNFYRLLFVAAAGWLLLTLTLVVVVGNRVSSSRPTRDYMGAANGAPPPIFQESR